MADDRKRKPDLSGEGGTKTKVNKVSQCYKKLYSEMWPCLKVSEKGNSHVFCYICVNHISIAHGGRDDCRRHVASKKHMELFRAKQGMKPMELFMKKQDSDFDVIKAETIFAGVIVEMNLPISLSTVMSTTFSKMFPDSEIARKYSSGRSKTTAIINDLAHQTQETVQSRMKNQAFSLATDGSNDGVSKQFPIVVRTFNNNLKENVVSQVLSIPTCSGSATGENIFLLLDKELTTWGLSWNNCLSLGSDNANVMSGRKKGVIGFILQRNSQVFFSGCSCHLVHLAAEKASSELPVSVEDFLIDVYYYLDKSSKRLSTLREYQSLCSVKEHKILKHVPTRWLSIGVCLSRILEQWDPLLMFIKAEKEKEKDKKKVSQKDKTKDSHSDRDKAENKKASHTDSSKQKDAHREKQKHKDSKTSKLQSEEKKYSQKDKTKDSHSDRDKIEKMKDSHTNSGKQKNAHKDSKSSKPQSDKKKDFQKDKTESDKSHKTHKLVLTSSRKDSTCSQRKDDTDRQKSSTSQTKRPRLSAGDRLGRIFAMMKTPKFLLYCQFLHFTVPVFDSINVSLQQEAPLIHKLRRLLHEFMKKLLMRFVTPKAMSDKPVYKVNFQRSEQKDDAELVIGSETRHLLKDKSVDTGISASEVSEFYQCVRNFFMRSCTYIKNSFPLEDELLQHAEVADVQLRESVKFSSIEYFLDRFQSVCLLPEGGTVDQLQEEFMEYQCDPLTEEVLLCEREDTKWVTISSLVNSSKAPKYKLLPHTMLSILTIPHSNAECERVFSLIRKNKTDFRATLGDNTLESLMILRSSPGMCYERVYTDTELKRLKSAYYKSLKEM